MKLVEQSRTLEAAGHDLIAVKGTELTYLRDTDSYQPMRGLNVCVEAVAQQG